MTVEFTAHNIRLDDGTFTRPDSTMSNGRIPVVHISSSGPRNRVPRGQKVNSAWPMWVVWRVDNAVEFARMGFRVLGIEVRESNIAAVQLCQIEH